MRDSISEHVYFHLSSSASFMFMSPDHISGRCVYSPLKSLKLSTAIEISYGTFGSAMKKFKPFKKSNEDIGRADKVQNTLTQSELKTNALEASSPIRFNIYCNTNVTGYLL